MQAEETVLASYGPTKTANLTMLAHGLWATRVSIGFHCLPVWLAARLRAGRLEIGDFRPASEGAPEPLDAGPVAQRVLWSVEQSEGKECDRAS